MRAGQPEGQRGSLKWIQKAVEKRPDTLQPSDLGRINWLSPTRHDDFAEYRDEAFLRLLGLSHLDASLNDFWPRRGPQWDALGKAGDSVVLVEAKAHIGEFLTPGSKASDRSLQKIDAAFAQVRRSLTATGATDWSVTYYQYANRIAHLWWLRKNGVDAHLLFVSFLGDSDPAIKGPRCKETWRAAYDAADYALGLKKNHKLSRFVHHVMPEVADLNT